MESMNHSWVVYEIPGHKVGLCQAHRYPVRPARQVNELKGRPKHAKTKAHDIKVLQRLDELTNREAREVETEWQDKLGYVADIDNIWLSVNTEATKAKLSSIHKGKSVSVETRAKIAAAITGTTHTEEAKAKMRAAKRTKRSEA